jgi:hypothetical protein
MFKEIPDFNGYLINPKGAILNKRTRKRLSPNDNGSGYLQVQFRDKKNYFVHRLVAATFIPNPDNKPCVDHIDGNKKNNAVDNLRWVTASENYYGYGYMERKEARQRAVVAENVVTGEVINFKSRNACAHYFRCDKSKIKYDWLYVRGNKKDWVFTLAG